jgi:hypothetical protein
MIGFNSHSRCWAYKELREFAWIALRDEYLHRDVVLECHVVRRRCRGADTKEQYNYYEIRYE